MVEENMFEYAMVCDMTNHDSIERLRRLKEVEATKASIYFFQLQQDHMLIKNCSVHICFLKKGAYVLINLTRKRDEKALRAHMFSDDMHTFI
nr:DHBP synthase RibB-like alpha/beta domain-containing protein [Tanacetum cinerariifolium]